MGEPLRRLCVLRDDTLVQYAACLPSSFWEVVSQFDSDYSDGEGASPHFLFAGQFDFPFTWKDTMKDSRILLISLGIKDLGC